jgi:hypothetical protein
MSNRPIGQCQEHDRGNQSILDFVAVAWGWKGLLGHWKCDFGKIEGQKLARD